MTLQSNVLLHHTKIVTYIKKGLQVVKQCEYLKVM